MDNAQNNFSGYNLIKRSTLASAVVLALGVTSVPMPVSADVFTFTFGPGNTPIDPVDPRANEGFFTMIDPGGDALINTSRPYYYDATWGYGFRTQITGTLTFDTTDNSGTLTIQPFSFLNGGNAEFVDIAFTSAGNDPVTGHPLIIANMLMNWAGNDNLPASIVWDVEGLVNAINAGLNEGDIVSGGAIPATEGIRKGIFPLGPAPVASTTWDTTNLCTESCNPSGGLPLIPDDIAGDPFFNGPFPGFSPTFEIAQLRVASAADVLSIVIQIPAGTPQECSELGGSPVAMNVNVLLPDGDTIGSISWKLDGNPVASGESVELFVPLGAHTIEAEVVTAAGIRKTDNAVIVIEDTVAPVINAGFVDPRTQEIIVTPTQSGMAEISIDVNDACDPTPISHATSGFAVGDGDRVRARSGRNDSNVDLSFKASTNIIELSVTAEDESGNLTNQKATLTVNE